MQTGYHQPLKGQGSRDMGSIAEDEVLQGVDFGQETEFREDQKHYRKTGFQKSDMKMDAYADYCE